MEPSTLLDNVSSEYLEAFSALGPKDAGHKVLVYVESHDDVAFWRDILKPFEEDNIEFDIQLPVQNNLRMGKLAVLEFANRTGTHLILCVDSDYDYLSVDSVLNSNTAYKDCFLYQKIHEDLERYIQELREAISSSYLDI